MVGQTGFHGMIVENTDAHFSARVFLRLARLLFLKASSKWGELIPDQFETKTMSWGRNVSCRCACVPVCVHVCGCETKMTSWHMPAFLLSTTGGRLSQLNEQTDQSKTCPTFVNKIEMQWLCTYHLPLASKGNRNLKGGTVFICFIINCLTIQDSPFRGCFLESYLSVGTALRKLLVGPTIQ